MKDDVGIFIVLVDLLCAGLLLFFRTARWLRPGSFSEPFVDWVDSCLKVVVTAATLFIVGRFVLVKSQAAGAAGAAGLDGIVIPGGTLGILALGVVLALVIVLALVALAVGRDS